MTGKEIILEYLKTHEQFSPHELALITGIPNNRIAQAARHMVKQGHLSVVERKWKTVIYAKRKVKKEPIKREGANKRGNSSRLTQSFHFFMFEPIFSPVNALNQPI